MDALLIWADDGGKAWEEDSSMSMFLGDDFHAAWRDNPMDSAGRITDKYVDELLLWWKCDDRTPYPNERLMRQLEQEAGISESQAIDFRKSIAYAFRFDLEADREQQQKLRNYVAEYFSELKQKHCDDWFARTSVKTTPIDKEAIMDLDVRMSEAIRNATRHIRSLTYQEHLKLDRNERVGQFCTSLRREITSLRYEGRYNSAFSHNIEHNLSKLLIDRLCNKVWWYDSGILESEVVFSRHHFGTVDLGKEGMMTRDRLQKWVDYANSSSTEDEDLANIGQGLDRLSREMSVFEMHVKKAKEINLEADVVMNNITNILVEAAA